MCKYLLCKVSPPILILSLMTGLASSFTSSSPVSGSMCSSRSCFLCLCFLCFLRFLLGDSEQEQNVLCKFNFMFNMFSFSLVCGGSGHFHVGYQALFVSVDFILMPIMQIKMPTTLCTSLFRVSSNLGM